MERSGVPHEKPIRPSERGERWMMDDGRRVTLLRLLGVSDDKTRCFEVLNEQGRLEAVYEPHFFARIFPPTKEKYDDQSPTPHFK